MSGCAQNRIEGLSLVVPSSKLKQWVFDALFPLGSRIFPKVMPVYEKPEKGMTGLRRSLGLYQTKPGYWFTNVTVWSSVFTSNVYPTGPSPSSHLYVTVQSPSPSLPPCPSACRPLDALH